MRAIKVSLKTAKHLVDVLGLSGHSGDVAAVRELRAAMAPKKFVRAAKARKTAKKATKKTETAAIREAVMKRANGFCECCGVPTGPTYRSEPEMDHFFGRARVPQNERNCWILRGGCHREKTSGRPSPEWWHWRFVAHCERYGFHAEARRARNRLGAADMVSRAAALSREARNV